MKKTDFIRINLEYLKIIRSNKYVKDIKLYRPDQAWRCNFYFEPFNDNYQIVLQIANYFNKEGHTELKIISNNNDYIPSNLADNYFSQYKESKYISIDEFKNLMNNIHDWTINLIIKSNDNFDIIIMLLNQYLPGNYLSQIEIENLVKSKLGINKFNL